MSNNNFRIQDDLYEFVNHEDLKKREIPSDLPTIGGFRDLAISTEKKLMAEFENFSKNPSAIDCKFVKYAVDIYNKALSNTKEPSEVKHILDSYISKIKSINSIEEFNENFSYFYNNQIPLPFVFGVDVDMKSTKNHCLVISSLSTILPDTTYYEKGNVSKEPLLQLWSNMTKDILGFFFEDKEEVKTLIKETLQFDELISKIVKSRVEWADYTKNYNPIDFNEVEKLLKPVNFRNIVSTVYNSLPEKIIVFDPRFLKEFNKLFNDKTFNLFKSWALVHFIGESSEFLCDKLRILSGVYTRGLSGVKEPYEIKKYSFKLAADRLLAEPIGIYYGKKFFGEKAKADVINIVKGLITSYKERLSTNNWLSVETREKAILKLDKMKIKIGYPDKLSEVYNHIEFDPNANLFEIVKKINQCKINYENSLLHKPVDTSKWYMPGHLVNACYSPTSNDITFPAAILQKPFYSIDQSRAENFGGIGAVIGHEISHAFDNNGAQFDDEGNLNNWWKERDYKKFQDKTQEMIKQFDGLPLGKGKVNGTLVVSENIADLGGVAASIQTMEREKSTDYKKFFTNFAKIWAQKARPEYEQLLLTTDVHAPTYWRTNMPPRNFKQWYETFDVKSTDKMYLPEDKRLVIW